MSKCNKTTPDLAEAIILELSPKRIMKEASISKASVSRWKKYGMPLYFQQFLRARYPELNVWTVYKVRL